MTLLLTLASRDFILQVSDRLVTKNGSPFDPMANKSLVYRAQDAIVTMAYTGSAYIAGQPTDVYLAEAILGEKHEGGLRIGPSRHVMTIGPAIKLLAEKLAIGFANSRTSSDAREMPFELIITGWQANQSNRARPFIAG